jgi:hypothetical protein
LLWFINSVINLEKIEGWPWWLKPVITAIGEQRFGESWFKDILAKNVFKTPFQPTKMLDAGAHTNHLRCMENITNKIAVWDSMA